MKTKCTWCGAAMMAGGAILTGVGLGAIITDITTSTNPWIVLGFGCICIISGWVTQEQRK